VQVLRVCLVFNFTFRLFEIKTYNCDDSHIFLSLENPAGQCPPFRETMNEQVYIILIQT
jgi:hypothetical protein